ncbi:MAG: DUF3710 domain-containing protein [Streptosporangiales bacterium]|nr:DUF3710 domain-containing protein [Streptosporangiales bacterium]
MFRRRPGRHARHSSEDLEVYDSLDTDTEESSDPEGSEDFEESEVPEERQEGPWDVDEPAPDIERVDLGALRVPVGPDLEVQANIVDDQVIAATVLHEQSALQIQALAAPKSTGIWADVRREVVRDLQGADGSAEEVEGEFGTELRGRVPTDMPDRGVVPLPARFVGVDGPRWLLRGVFTGPAAESADAAGRLEEVFRGIVVVRGDAPMPPHTLLELRLPRDVRQAGSEEASAEERDRFDINPFRRGPEITETR